MKIKNIKIKNILYTTDLSDTALHIFSYAVSLAELYNASITILHVIGDWTLEEVEPRLILSGMLKEGEYKAIRQRHVDEVRETLTGKSRVNEILHDALTRFAQNVLSDKDTPPFKEDNTIVLFGNPVDKIIETSTERNSDLIVMGAHGYGGFLQDLIGSTTRRVLRKSKIPVLVVRLEET